MSRFVDKPSPRYKEALKILKTLIKEESVWQTQTVYAEATSDHLKKAYAEEFGLKESKGLRCIRFLLGRECDEIQHGTKYEDGIPCRLPQFDHASLWLKNGEPYSITCHPYGLCIETMKGIIELVEEFKLNVYLCADRSWHNPGNTLFIEVKKK